MRRPTGPYRSQMTARRPLLGALLSAAACLLGAAPAFSAQQPASELQQLQSAGVRDIIVQRKPHLTVAERAQVRSRAHVTYVHGTRLAGVEVVRAPAGKLAETVAKLNADPDVEYAEADGPVQAQSSDPFFSSQWALENMDVPEAWALTRGDGQTVAVVDTGGELAHVDLAGQFASNPGESGNGKESNGIDDDGDGYVDDYQGWDFVDGDNTPEDQNGHGTHVTGVIAALSDNGTGIAGVAPEAKAVELRVLDSTGSGFDSDVAVAFDYAGDKRIPIVNASLGGGYSQTVEDAIAAHPDTLYVVAAGNDAADNDQAQTAEYPCALPEANVICVGASDQNDGPANFSNFGASSVDIFAPGVNIVSTYDASPTAYANMSGTSMATPQVSGVLALMRSANPALTPAQLKSLLLSSGDPRAALSGLSATSMRVNGAQAVTAAQNSIDSDGDGDGVPDGTDNCAAVANADQLNTDGDSMGDACDPDDDNDTVADTADNCPRAANAGQADADRDGVGDICDPTPDGPPSTNPTAPTAAPVLTKPTLSRTTITRTRAATIRFRLNRAATVRLVVARKTGGRYKAAGVVSMVAAKGINRYTLKRKFGKARLRPGRYKLTVQAFDGARSSKRYTVRFTVRG